MKELGEDFSPMVSVLIPVFNTKKYLNECIKSMLNQSYTNFEIIALDDGSTDGSSEVLNQLASDDNRIRVVHKNNSGYGDTMNVGISMARGRYIAILESDDYAEADMIKVLYNKAEQMDADLVLANYFMDHVDEDGLSLVETVSIDNLAGVNYEVYLTEEERKRLAYTTPALWRCLYKKDYLLRENICFLPTPGAAFQDTSFFIKAVMMTEKAVYISDKVLHYRRGQIGASVKDVNKIYCICDELGEVERYIVDKNQYSWQTQYPLILYIKYSWNYKRLSEPARSEFMQRFKTEMIAMDLNGWLDKAVWPEWRYKQMLELLDYEEIKPVKIKRVMSMNANQRLKLNQFIASLSLHDEVILYGAGVYGDLVLQRIYDWRLYKKIKFALTDEPKKSIHKGIDVFPIEYFKKYVGSFVIIVSVGEDLTDEMVKNLNELEITNYITLDADLRSALKEDPGSWVEKALRDQTDLLRKTIEKEKEHIQLVEKTNVLLHDMLDRMRDENELLRENYMKVGLLEKRMDKLETFMREEEICRINTDKILNLLNNTNKA